MVKIPPINAKAELARRRHLDFIKYCWVKNNPFLVGEHTSKICQAIDNALKRYRQGKSSYLIIKVPFRHGKSDLVSRYLPPHLLGEFPDAEIAVATYGQDLANIFSRFARSMVKTDKYKEIYPTIDISKDAANVTNWGTGKGSTSWVGIGGGLTGKGYDFGIIDDFLKNRKDAESETVRNSQWEWFTDVFMTRGAPVSVTIILATPWHLGDIIGRIEDRNNPKSDNYDEDFPKFDVIRFPAISDEYKSGYLFPERFSKDWYLSKQAILGTYGSASLLQCSPTLKGGNFLKTSGIKIIKKDQLPVGLRFVRGWDLASSEKERLKTDPDYTCGVKLAVKWIDKSDVKERMPILYIGHVERIRAEAPERNAVIVRTAETDGNIQVGVETVAGYKDTYTIIKDILKGIRYVRNINVSRDKLSRWSALEPIFEAGNVYLVEGEWNQAFIDEAGSVPSGAHDDQIDGLICAYEMESKSNMGSTV